MKQLLVIEDDPALSFMFVEFLRLKGFTVINALDGLTGLNLGKTFQPDLILCDFKLPTMNGLEILQHLRQNSLTMTTPFILITSCPSSDLHRRALQFGANAFLKKPILLDELFCTITEII